LLAGIGEVAIIAGLTQIVAVFDERFYRVLKAAGSPPQIIGAPRRIGSAMSYAGLFDTGEGPLQAVRAPLGIEGSVFAPDALELAFGPTGALAPRAAEKEPSRQEPR
jgi:N-acyl-L-homoserine lactone synthetase